MENLDFGGCETLETPNLFLNPSIVSLVTIDFEVFYYRKICSQSPNSSFFI